MKEQDIRDLAKLYQDYLNLITEQLDLLEKEAISQKKIDLLISIANSITLLEEHIENDKKAIADMPSSAQKRSVQALYANLIGNLFQNRLNREIARTLQSQENLLKILNTEKTKMALSRFSDFTARMETMYQSIASRNTPFAIDYLERLNKFREHLYTLLALKDFVNHQNNLVQALGTFRDTFVSYVEKTTTENQRTNLQLQEAQVEHSVSEFFKKVEEVTKDPNELVMDHLRVLELILSHRTNALGKMHKLLHEIALVNVQRLEVHKPFNILDDKGLPALIEKLKKQAKSILDEESNLHKIILEIYQFLYDGQTLKNNPQFQQQFQDKITSLFAKLNASSERLRKVYEEQRQNLIAFEEMYEMELNMLMTGWKSDVNYQRDFNRNASVLRELRQVRTENLISQSNLIKILSTTPAIYAASAKRESDIANLVKKDPEKLFELPEQLMSTFKALLAGNKAAFEMLFEASALYQQDLLARASFVVASTPDVINIQESIKTIFEKHSFYEEAMLAILEDINDLTMHYYVLKSTGTVNLPQEVSRLKTKIEDLEKRLNEYELASIQMHKKLIADLKSHEAFIKKLPEGDKEIQLKHDNLLLQLDILSTREAIIRGNIKRQINTLSNGLKVVAIVQTPQTTRHMLTVSGYQARKEEVTKAGIPFIEKENRRTRPR